ncbi:MAG: hypothetical protein RL154_80 [Pseudomonadota bacterium]|jgi:flagellar biosynthesis protein
MTPNAKAVALKYEDGGSKAPTVLAKGKGYLAEQIIKKASELDVPIFQNEALASSLLSVDINEQIPPALYNAVVEVFVWLMKNEKNANH